LELCVSVSLRGFVVILVLGAAALSACSPTFNWRELRPEGAPLVALMPCKPETATRSVPMLGQPTELHMYSCETGGLTFAVAWAKVGDSAKAGEALAQWQQASLASVRVAPGAATAWAAAVARADQVQGAKGQGSDHQGKPLNTQAVYFAQGNWVYQAAMYGPKLPEQATTAFFDGLALP
jgi:hypothetical protein